MQDGTLKVTPITAAQPQAHAKFSITAVIDGFPVSIEVEGKADALRGMIDRLKAIGAQPPKSTSGSIDPEVPTKAAGVPVCPIHNSQMKPSQKPGAFFCPKKDESGAYCRHKA